MFKLIFIGFLLYLLYQITIRPFFLGYRSDEQERFVVKKKKENKENNDFKGGEYIDYEDVE